MKQRFWLWKRNGVFYLDDSLTRKKTSLQTRDVKEAERIRDLRNEAEKQPQLVHTLARALLGSRDPKVTTRTWADVMSEQTSRGRESTQERCLRQIKTRSLDAIRNKPLLQTSADDFISILKVAGAATNEFLRRLQNFALGMGWLLTPILPTKLWPKVRPKVKRAISFEEFQKIIQTEKNEERRLYYELLWETGASQTDAANLTAENIDWSRRLLIYHRQKLAAEAKPAVLTIGVKLERVLKSLPASGALFPNITQTSGGDRSSEFCRRCRILGFKGISLHSFRYSWAERANKAGYPQRWAEAALGHSSPAVHWGYAKSAIIVCPPLEEYEKRLTT